MIIPDKRMPLIEVFLRHNAVINLSAIRDVEGVYSKHILDSVELLQIDGFSDYLSNTNNNLKIVDVGTGGGFPLLPLAILLPQHHFVGVDSIRKKLQAIQDMSSELSIDNVEFLWSRIEECSIDSDIITARAVAHVEKLLPWLEKMLKAGVKLVLYKQLKTEESDEGSEKQCLINMLKQYKLTLLHEHQYTLFDGDIRRVIYILEKGL